MKETNANPLLLHWLVVASVCVSMIVFLVCSHVFQQALQQGIDAGQRELIRSILYVVGIILLPFTKLVRYILLRLNHTMPGQRSAASRYFITVLVTQMMIEWLAIFGFVMFVLGDDFNTLYIFMVMAVLGVYFHRPVLQEYFGIEDAVRHMGESVE